MAENSTEASAHDCKKPIVTLEDLGEAFEIQGACTNMHSYRIIVETRLTTNTETSLKRLFQLSGE